MRKGKGIRKGKGKGAPKKKSAARKASKGISKIDRQILSGRLITSSAFREDFLKDPKKAAAQLGIKLSEADQHEVLTQVDLLRSAAEFGEHALKARPKNPFEPHGGIVTGWILD